MWAMHDDQRPAPESAPATFSRSALVFLGFALVVAVDSVLAGSFNPDRGTAVFWIELVIFFGGLLVWSLWIARWLSRGTGAVAAYCFLGLITGCALISLLIQLGGGFAETTPFPGIRALSIARACSGLYLLFAWVVLVWETVVKSW
jgi:hypothetical protein